MPSITEVIKANPDLNNRQIADLCNTTMKTVRTKRSLLKKQKDHPAAAVEAEKIGFPIDKLGGYWVKTDGFSFSVRGDAPNSEESTLDEVIEAACAQMDAHSPNYKPFHYHKKKDPHLFVYDPADIHVNKLAIAYETGEDYNSQIAVQRCREGLNGLLNKLFGYEFDEILFILGNDALNADGPTNQTTKGTPQAVHLIWTEAWLMAAGIYIEQIEICATIAPVVIKFCPSNHDVMSGWFLVQYLMAHFRLDNRISFDGSTAHRKYHRYGANLIGATHGDAAKPDKLPLLMAYEAKEDWGQCKHYYVYTHHIHHKDVKDYGPVCVEAMRSPTSADGWHHRNGFIGAPKAIEGFVHHPVHGQIMRVTHIF